MTTVGKASIKFEADVGQVSDTLVAKMEQALTKIDQILAKLSSNVTTSAKSAGDAVGKNVEDGAKKADRAVSGVGKDGFDAVEKASRTAADTVAKEFEEGSSKAGTALDRIDGTGFAKVSTAATGAASTIESRMSGAAATAASALDKVDGSTLDKAAASAASAASTIESRVPPAASRAGEAMRKAGRDGEEGFEGARSSAGLLEGALGKVAVAAAALAGPATIVQKGWARLTSIDDARHKLMALGHEGQQIEQIMDNAMASVTGTAFGFGDAAGLAATLVAAGIEPGQQLERTLKLVADSASVAGVDLNEMGSIWGKVAATGKVSGEEMAQMLDRQIGLQTALADHYGVTAAEAAKMVSDGKVSFEDFATVMEDMVGGGAEVMGATVSASFANVGAAAGRLGAQLLGTVFQAAPDFLGGVQKGLGWATNQLQSFQEWLNEGSLAADLLKVALIAVGSTAVVGAIVGTIGQLSTMAQVTALVQRGVQMMNLAFLASPWGLAIAGVTALVAGFVMLWNRSEAFRNFWIGLWESVKTAAAPVLEWITTAFTGLRDLIIGGDFTGALRDAFGWEEDNAVVNGILRVRDAFTGFWDLVVNGDYTAALSNAFGIEEDMPIVVAILSIRDALMEIPELASGIADILFRGDFTGLPFGLEEDSPAVGVLFAIRDAVIATWERLRELGATLIDVGRQIGAAQWATFKIVLESVWSVVQSLWGVFTSLAGAVWELIQALAPILLPVLKMIGVIVGGVVVGAFFALMGALQLVARLVSVVAQVVGWLAQNVLVPLISVIATVVTWLVDKLAGALSWVADLIGSVFAGVWPALQAMWSGIQDGWASFTSWLGEAWAGLQAIWSSYGQPVVDFVVSAWGFLWEGVQLYFRLLGAAWEVFTTALGKAWAAWGQPVVDWVISGFEWLGQKVGLALDWVSEKWGLVTAWLATQWAAYGQPIVDTVITGFLWLADRVAFALDWVNLQVLKVQFALAVFWHEHVRPVIDWVIGKFELLRFMIDYALAWIRFQIDLAGYKMRQFWFEYVQPMIDRVTDGFQRLRDTIGEWKDRIISWFRDAGTWLLNAGRDIIDGLINGVKSKAREVKDAFLNVVPDWVKDPFKEALGIASPSRVFAEFGRNIGEGIIQGVQGVSGQVEAATRDLAASAASVAQTAAPVVDLAVTGDYTAGTREGTGWEEDSSEVEAILSARDALGAAVAGDWEAAAVSGQQAFAAAADALQGPSTMINDLIGGLSSTATQFGSTVQTSTGSVAVPAWRSMSAFIQQQQNGVLNPTMQALQSRLGMVAAQFQTDTSSRISPAWQTMGSGIMNVKTGQIDPAFSGIQSGMTNVVSAFANGARDVGVHMDQMRKNTQDPVRFTMNTVFSDGLVEMWNSVSDMIGTTKMSKRYAAFAQGGIMPGYTPGRDVHRFFSPTGGVLDLSGGEPVLRPEAGQVLGSDWVHGINAAAASGGTRAVSRFLGSFASGGFLPYVGGFRPGGVIYGGGMGGLTPITRSHAEWVGKHFPGMFTLTSALRFTDSGHHSTGKATDWQAADGQFATQMPTPASKALARAMYRTFPTAAELIHWPEDGWQNLSNGRPYNFGPATNRGHANHVHFATHGPIGSGASGLDSVDINWDVDWDKMLRDWVAPDLDRVTASVGSRSFPGKVGGVPRGVFDSMQEPMLKSMAQSMKDSMMVIGGESVERWRPLAMQALQRHGYNPRDHIDAMMQQIQIESNGDPGAVNLWDSNYLMGDPSGGLLQVIGGTYRRVRAAYPEAFAGLPDDRMFPLTNLTAGVGAVRMDWGGPAGRWPTRDGYAHGGLMGEGQGWFHKTAFAPERVLSPRQTMKFEELVDFVTNTPDPRIDRRGGGTAGGYGGGMTRQVHVTQNIVTSDPKSAADEVENRLTKLLV